MSRRLGATVLVTAGLLGAASPAHAACANVSTPAKQLGSVVARPTTICEINRYRVFHGLRKVRFDRRLRTAATRHAQDMVRRDYFSHRTPEGRGVIDRATAAGALAATADRPAGSKRLFGENLAWRFVGEASPAVIVLWWSMSPGHRKVLLDPRYRYVGVGIAHGAPVETDELATTYAAVFAT